eukprot:168613-Amorphochlora_amoeboformis.AAC.1
MQPKGISCGVVSRNEGFIGSLQDPYDQYEILRGGLRDWSTRVFDKDIDKDIVDKDSRQGYSAR